MKVRAMWFALGSISTLTAIAAAWLAETIDGFRT